MTDGPECGTERGDAPGDVPDGVPRHCDRTRDGRSVVGMAAGYAVTHRYRGADGPPGVGVALLHATPGLAHGLSNLYNASYAGVPLVVLAGAHGTDFRHEEPLLAGDLPGLADEFTKWSAVVGHVDALAPMLRRAFRTALAPPTGPVFLSLPMDVMEAATDAAPERPGADPGGRLRNRTRHARRPGVTRWTSETTTLRSSMLPLRFAATPGTARPDNNKLRVLF